MHSIRYIFAALFGLLAASCATVQDSPTPAARQFLAPSGKLRVALLEGSPVHVVGNLATGEAKGVGHDLGKELAARLGVPFEPVAYKAVGPMLNGAKSGQWDVAFIGVSPERRQFLAFTGKHMELEIGYLVPPGSPIASLGDVDRTGIRVAVVEKGSPDVFLTGALSNATLVRASTLAASLDLVRSGKAEAFAGLKANLYDVSSRQMPGSRLLDGKPGSEEQALAMPKGRDPAATYASAFIEQAKSQGLVQAAIDRVQLRGAVVAP
jgi:polar amino acid transport system substrate-binding protein